VCRRKNLQDAQAPWDDSKLATKKKRGLSKDKKPREVRCARKKGSALKRGKRRMSQKYCLKRKMQWNGLMDAPKKWKRGGGNERSETKGRETGRRRRLRDTPKKGPGGGGKWHAG